VLSNTGDVLILPYIRAAGSLALRGVTWRYVVAHGRRRRCNGLLRFQIGPCAGIDALSTPCAISHLVVQGDAAQLDAVRSSISANAEISDVVALI
jgi:hypothetical protein